MHVPRPVQYTDGTEDILASPWVEVAAPDWRMFNMSLGQFAADLDVTVAVRGHMEDARAGMLNKRLQILGAALVDSLIQPDAFTTNASRVTIREMRGSYPINPSTGEKQFYVGAAVILITLEVGEQRYSA